MVLNSRFLINRELQEKISLINKLEGKILELERQESDKIIGLECRINELERQDNCKLIEHISEIEISDYNNK